MYEEPTTAAIQRYLDALPEDPAAEPIVWERLERAVCRLRLLCDSRDAGERERLGTGIQERQTMPRSVFVHSGSLRYDQNISVGPHVLHADEPSDYGGNDVGPNPYELLLAALGACTSMTVRMYAERKQWPLHAVQVSLSHEKVHAEDCAECETKVGIIDRIAVGISFTGDLSEEQQGKLLEIASKCPVHRTLVSRSQIDTRLEWNHV